jgi:Zn-finger nucleic acid-binding protein
MKCSNCQIELKAVDCKGIVIDECDKCKGKWFDRDELRKAKDRTDEDLKWLDFDPFGEDAEKLSMVSEGKMCPKCSNKMSSLKYMDSEVVIDKCPGCKGVWLDPGEFMKIIEYLKDRIYSETAKGYAKETFKEFVEIFTGPEGVVSETKDFMTVLYLLQLRIAVENPKLAETARKIYDVIPFR